MSCSWGKELWDQYDPICTHMDQNVEFIKRVSAFVKDRIHAETSYARDLRKLCKAYKKKEEQDSKYTMISGFAKLVSETNDLAGQRELISEYLQAEVLKPLGELAKMTHSERKRLMSEGADLHRSLKEAMETLDKIKRAYLKASEEKEAAEHALVKADQDPQSTKAKIDKLTQISRSKDQAAEEAKNNYILQLESANKFRSVHFGQKMPKLMDDFMDLNTRHLTQYQAMVAAYAESHRRVQPVITTCLNNITAASDAVVPETDNQQFISVHKTGYPVPGDVEFEEYLGKGRSVARSKKDDKKKLEARDYSHLPPEQRRKKLLKRINELESYYQKSLSDKSAMEKMRDIYSKNPQLGDAKQVAESMVATQEKIDGLAAEVTEFKGYLADAEAACGSPRPSKNGKSPSVKKKEKKEDKKSKSSSSSSSKLTSSEIAVVPSGSFTGKSNTTSAASSPPANVESEWEVIDGGSTADQQHEQWSDDEGASGVCTDSASNNSKQTTSVEDFAGSSSDGGRDATMLYDFDAQTDDELSCKANEVIKVVEDMGDGWLRVRRGTDEGYIPESYVNYL